MCGNGLRSLYLARRPRLEFTKRQHARELEWNGLGEATGFSGIQRGSLVGFERFDLAVWSSSDAATDTNSGCDSDANSNAVAITVSESNSVIY